MITHFTAQKGKTILSRWIPSKVTWAWSWPTREDVTYVKASLIGWDFSHVTCDNRALSINGTLWGPWQAWNAGLSLRGSVKPDPTWINGHGHALIWNIDNGITPLLPINVLFVFNSVRTAFVQDPALRQRSEQMRSELLRCNSFTCHSKNN